MNDIQTCLRVTSASLVPPFGIEYSQRPPTQIQNKKNFIRHLHTRDLIKTHEQRKETKTKNASAPKVKWKHVLMSNIQAKLMYQTQLNNSANMI